MKVAHLTTVDLSLRFLVFPQLLSITERGGEAIGISAPGEWVEELQRAGVSHIPIHASTRGFDLGADFRAARELWRVLRRERPDVLHTHNPKPGVYGRILGRLAGVPIVVNTVHGVYATEDDPLLKRLVVYLLEAIAARFSDAELVQSREDFSLLTRWRITRPTRARHLGNGVDLARFDPERLGSSVRSGLRTELGIGDDEVMSLTVGRLVVEKGYEELFRAAGQFGEGYTFVVVGPEDPEKGDALPREVVDEARRSGVRFLGMRTDIENLYLAADIFVLPSHREGFSRSGMEAAAMGLPIVATDIRGLREVVEDGVNGVLVPVGAPHRLAEAIRRLGEDRGLRVEMGRASRRKAKEEFDEAQVVRVVLDTYRLAAERKGFVSLVRALNSDSHEIRIRTAVSADAPALARLHIGSVEKGFLPRLGYRFMRLLYEALISWEGSVVLVADDGLGPVGFVAAVSDVPAFYRGFLKSHGWRAALIAGPKVVKPDIARRAWETFRYSEVDIGVPAEFLSMAVAPEARGQGVSTKMMTMMLDRLRDIGAEKVKVVVGKPNVTAYQAIRKMGFEPVGTMEVHAGEPSEVMVWSA